MMDYIVIIHHCHCRIKQDYKFHLANSKAVRFSKDIEECKYAFT